MGRRKKLVNDTSIPEHEIEAIARCILPDILAFYESEEGQREYIEWKRQQKAISQAIEEELEKMGHHPPG